MSDMDQPWFLANKTDEMTRAFMKAFEGRLNDFDVVVLFAAKSGDRRAKEIVCVSTVLGREILADAMRLAGDGLRRCKVEEEVGPNTP